MTDKNMDEVTEDELKEGMNSLFNGILRKAEEERRNDAGEIFHEDWMENLLTMKSHLDITDPEKLNLMKSLVLEYPMDELVSYALAMLLSKRNIRSVDKEAANKLKYLFRNYAIADRHVRSVYVGIVGHSCCADKSRYLLRSYTEYLLTGTIPEVPEKREYWHQECGTYEEWFVFIEQSVNIKYANNVELYMKSRANLSLQYIAYAKKVKEEYEKDKNQKG